MKIKSSRLILVILIICLLLNALACTAPVSTSPPETASAAPVSTSPPEAASAEQTKHAPITQELIDIVNNDAEIKVLLEKTIAKAKEINPDKATNPAQTLSEYYDFIDWASTCMPWNIISGASLPKLYEQMDQGLNYICFINDIELDELEGKGLYRNAISYYEPYRSWYINFAKAWGSFLDTEQSWNDDYYKIALADERFGISKGQYESPSNWKTFNQFFSRYLKSPSVRPIASPNDDSVVVSPADSTPQGVWKIDADSNLIQKEGVLIKSKVFDSVAAIVGTESKFSKEFAGGTLTHTFLDVNDYHRYHFPVGGVIKEIRIIPGDDATGGYVEWDPKQKKYVLKEDTPGWQSIETRGCIIIENPEYGLVAVLPVGMSQVSSVNFESNLKVGDTVKKGDMLGAFLFGGSDIIMLFQKDVEFKLTVPEKNKKYYHVQMGEAYGTLTKN